jgi:hypothetical protein
MERKKPLRKRPCRICRKWFWPNPRLGERQKTCCKECQRQWHAKRCREWNRKNRRVSKENYLKNRLDLCVVPKPAPARGSPPQYPRAVVQEVIGEQLPVIIEYLLQQHRRGVQEVIRKQSIENKGKSDRLPYGSISRGNRLARPEPVSLPP